MKVSGGARVSRLRGSVNKIQPNKVNMLYHLILSGNFLAQKFGMGFFGVNFWSKDGLVLSDAIGIFGGF